VRPISWVASWKYVISGSFRFDFRVSRWLGQVLGSARLPKPVAGKDHPGPRLGLSERGRLAARSRKLAERHRRTVWAFGPMSCGRSEAATTHSHARHSRSQLAGARIKHGDDRSRPKDSSKVSLRICGHPTARLGAPLARQPSPHRTPRCRCPVASAAEPRRPHDRPGPTRPCRHPC